jgi:hypothetical protein
MLKPLAAEPYRSVIQLQATPPKRSPQSLLPRVEQRSLAVYGRLVRARA